MHYEIEVNLARHRAEPVWRPLIDDNGEVCRWLNYAAVRVALVEEDRGENARLMRYDNTGLGRVWP
jgi:hypothetical protein